MEAAHASLAGLRVIVAEDDGMIMEAVCDRLSDAGFEVVATADNAADLIEATVSAVPDIVLMDVRLKGDMDGIRASELINEKVRVPIVYLTGDADQQTLQRAKAAFAYGYVIKPFHIKNLIVAIEVAIERFRMERRLQDSQLTHATILGSIADGVIAVDDGGRVRFMNAPAERLTGWPSTEAEGQLLEDVLTLVDGGALPRELIARVIDSRSTHLLGSDAFVTRRGGRRAPVEGAIACVIDALGRAVGISITLRDVTDARQAAADLKASEQQLRAVIDTAVDGVLVLDAEGAIVMINPAGERLFGYASGEMLGKRIDDVSSSLRWLDLKADEDGAERRRATLYRRRDGSTFPAETSIGKTSQVAQSRYVCIVHDVSERRILEAAYLGAVDLEQRRLGSDLHDGLGQELTGLVLLLSALTDAAREINSIHTADLVRAWEVARHALYSCQAIARGLSPVAPTEGGLVVALRDLVSRLKISSRPAVNITVREVARLGLSRVATDHLYRIAQEALANALKHARANAIHVSLAIEPERVMLEVCDDGQGVLAEAQPLGLGLRSMQYRASMIGAMFQVAPVRPQGTRVVCDCPQTV